MSSVAVVSEAFRFLLKAVETADDSLPEEVGTSDPLPDPAKSSWPRFLARWPRSCHDAKILPGCQDLARIKSHQLKTKLDSL